MKHLWAPWRMAYIVGECEERCIFCIKEDESAHDRERLILFRGKHAFVIMNRFPYTNGHLMVVPYRHTCEIDELEEQEVLELWSLVAASQRILKRVIFPQGFNIGLNLGQVAGAGVEDHLHVHLVPRWGGDTNFMPVMADIRVVPQYLEETFDLLVDEFAALKGDT